MKKFAFLVITVALAYCTAVVCFAQSETVYTETVYVTEITNQEIADYYLKYEDPDTSIPIPYYELFCSDVIHSARYLKKGSTMVVDITKHQKVPVEAFNEIAKRDVTIEMQSSWYKFSIYGADVGFIPEIKSYYEMTLQKAGDRTISELCGGKDVFQFSTQPNFSGFPGKMTLTLKVGMENADKPLYLYHYNPDTQQLTYKAEAASDAGGNISFPIYESTYYAITSSKIA